MLQYTLPAIFLSKISSGSQYNFVKIHSTWYPQYGALSLTLFSVIHTGLRNLIIQSFMFFIHFFRLLILPTYIEHHIIHSFLRHFWSAHHKQGWVWMKKMNITKSLLSSVALAHGALTKCFVLSNSFCLPAKCSPLYISNPDGFPEPQSHINLGTC